MALAGGALILAVAGGGIALASTTGPSTVTLHGTMMINPASDSDFGDNFHTSNDGSCTGSDGYDDLSAGASVTVHDPTGKVIATGALGEGRGIDGVGCIFNWRISNVPKEKFYGVEISHRGTVTFKSSQIKGGFDTDIGD